MNDKIQIRQAGRDDIYQVATFLDDCWKTAYRGIISDAYLDSLPNDERNKGRLQRFDEGGTDFLMMFDGDKLIGAAVFGKSFTEGYEEDGEVSAIYLREDYIGKRYGHELYMSIEQALAAKGFNNYVLDVLKDNVQAIQFYLAHGYEKVDDRSILLGDTDYPLIVMRKMKVWSL